MLTLFPDQAQSLSDLAARLTDPALELVGRAGARGDSVEMELELWRVLTAELRRELRERRSTPRHDDAPLDGALKKVVYRAALRVAAKRFRSSAYRTLRARRATRRLSRS